MTEGPARAAVVIPAFRAARTVASAIESVRTQTFGDWRCVVVDDGSDDATADVAAAAAIGDPRVQVLRLPDNRGRAAARNAGAAATETPYLGFLDADDRLMPDFLRLTVDALDRTPEIDAAKVKPQVTAPDGTEIAMDRAQFAAVSHSLVTTMLIRRAAFDIVGGWPESDVYRHGAPGGEDVGFMALFDHLFVTGRLDVALYAHISQPGGHLEKFLARTRAVDGRLVFADDDPDAAAAGAETRRLLRAFKRRIRAHVLAAWSPPPP